MNSHLIEERQELFGFSEIRLDRVALVHAEFPAVGNQVGIVLGNSRTELARGRSRGIRSKRHGVENRNAHTDLQTPHVRTDAVPRFFKEARPVFHASAVDARARMSAQKFVTEVTMAMLDVDEIEAGFPGHMCCANKVCNDRANLTVR